MVSLTYDIDWNTFNFLFAKRLPLSMWNRKAIGDWFPTIKIDEEGNAVPVGPVRKGTDAKSRFVEFLSPYGPRQCKRHAWIEGRGERLWDWLIFQVDHLNKINQRVQLQCVW
jgi:hypothetical protein